MNKTVTIEEREQYECADTMSMVTSGRVVGDHRIRLKLFSNVVCVHVYCRSNLHLTYMYTVWNRVIIIIIILIIFFKYPWVYSSQGLKAKS